MFSLCWIIKQEDCFKDSVHGEGREETPEDPVSKGGEREGLLDMALFDYRPRDFPQIRQMDSISSK